MRPNVKFSLRLTYSITIVDTQPDVRRGGCADSGHAGVHLQRPGRNGLVHQLYRRQDHRHCFWKGLGEGGYVVGSGSTSAWPGG